MLANEREGKGVELGSPRTVLAGVLTRFCDKVAHVQKHDYKVVEGLERPALDGEAAVTVRCEAALYLDANLPEHLARIGVDTDKVVALVVRGRLVRENVAAHQVAHDQVLGAMGNHRVARECLNWFSW